MATDIANNEAGDWYLDDGDFPLVTEGTEVAQFVKKKFKTFAGEWLYDIDFGLPWLDELSSTQTSVQQKLAILRKEITSVDEVRKINSLEYSFDEVTHVATVDYDADTIYAPIKDTIVQ